MSPRFLKEIPCLNPNNSIRDGIPNTVETIGVETLYRDFFSVNRYSLRHQTFDGSWTPVITREIFERGHAVAILPYDPQRDEVVMIEQFRAGAMVAGWHPWLMEIAAGIIEPGENPEDVAKRETLEETGLEVKRLEFIAHSLCTPGGSSESLAIYCAEVDATEHPETAGVAAEHEDIRVFRLPAEEALALLQKQTINNASTLIALQWLALNRTRIRAQWTE